MWLVETLQQLRMTTQTLMMTDSQCCFIQTEIGKTEGSSWWSLVSTLISTILMGVHQLNLAKQKHLLLGEEEREWQRWQVHNVDATFVASVWIPFYQITRESVDCRHEYTFCNTFQVIQSSICAWMAATWLLLQLTVNKIVCTSSACSCMGRN